MTVTCVLRNSAGKIAAAETEERVWNDMWTGDLFAGDMETMPADAGDYSKVRQDIWVADEMHFTQEGYDIYRELFLNALDDIL